MVITLTVPFERSAPEYNVSGVPGVHEQGRNHYSCLRGLMTAANAISRKYAMPVGVLGCETGEFRSKSGLQRADAVEEGTAMQLKRTEPSLDNPVAVSGGCGVVQFSNLSRSKGRVPVSSCLVYHLQETSTAYTACA